MNNCFTATSLRLSMVLVQSPGSGDKWPITIQDTHWLQWDLTQNFSLLTWTHKMLHQTNDSWLVNNSECYHSPVWSSESILSDSSYLLCEKSSKACRFLIPDKCFSFSLCWSGFSRLSVSCKRNQTTHSITQKICVPAWWVLTAAIWFLMISPLYYDQ